MTAVDYRTLNELWQRVKKAYEGTSMKGYQTGVPEGVEPQGGKAPGLAHRYAWFYVCTFVEPKTGWNLSLWVDGMDTQVMRWVLRDRGHPV